MAFWIRTWGPNKMNNSFTLPLPVVYVNEQERWHYHHHWHDLATNPEPPNAALDALGQEGWELVAACTAGQRLCYLFKRPGLAPAETDAGTNSAN